MHEEALIAIYPTRDAAERARAALRRLGIPESDIGSSADVPTATAEAVAGSFERFFEAGVPDYDRRRYDSGLGGSGQTVLAVRVDRGGADRERIAEALEAGDPLGFEGDTAATATEDDFIVPEPAGLVGRRVDGRPVDGPPRPDASPADAPRPRRQNRAGPSALISAFG